MGTGQRTHAAMAGRGRWARRTAGLVAALAAAGLLVGCGAAGGSGKARGTAAARPAGFGAARLSGALPRSYDGFGALTAPSTGTYASLPTSAAAGGVAGAPASVTFTPAKCKPVIWNGPDRARFGRNPAAVVPLGRPGDTSSGTQLWAELIAASGAPAKAALGTGPAPGCGTVRGEYRGRTLSFAEEKAPRLGAGSRGATVRTTAGERATRVVAFLGNGYVGVVYAQGSVSRTELGEFARSVYRTAHADLG